MTNPNEELYDVVNERSGDLVGNPERYVPLEALDFLNNLPFEEIEKIMETVED